MLDFQSAILRHPLRLCALFEDIDTPSSERGLPKRIIFIDIKIPQVALKLEKLMECRVREKMTGTEYKINDRDPREKGRRVWPWY